mgnify:CR=1 FL=1|tara:strand:+ start:454 stop:2166 length:1713 start_codon:yes stop_codon:yes gene_type:complete
MSDQTTMNNFTVQSVEYNAVAGDLITEYTGATVVMTLVPNTGFVIEAALFSPQTPLPQSITQITFAQSGDNVIMTMNVDSTFIMPTNNLSIPVCINGTSRQIGVIVKGKLDINTHDTGKSSTIITPANSFTDFEEEGLLDTTEEIITQTLSTASGYYFDNQPTISLVQGDPNNYSFTVTPSFTSQPDGSNRMTSAVCKAFYTYPDTSVDNQEILVFARAAEIPTIAQEITAYSINQSNIPNTGETRPISIIGVAGVAYTVTIVADVGSNPNFSGSGSNVWSGTMQGSIESESIIFPAVTQDVIYTVTIAGNLASPFGTNPFTLTQVEDVDFSIEFSTTNGAYTITPTELRLQIEPNQSQINEPTGQAFTYTCVITAGTSTPTNGFAPWSATRNDFTKFGGNDNGWNITKVQSFAAPDGSSLTVQVFGFIFDTLFNPTGTSANFGATLNVDSFIVSAPPTRAKTAASTFAYANSTVLCGQSSIVNNGFIFFTGTPNGGIPPNGTQLYDSTTSSGWTRGSGAFAIFPFVSPGTGGQDYLVVNSAGVVQSSSQCPSNTQNNNNNNNNNGDGIQ